MSSKMLINAMKKRTVYSKTVEKDKPVQLELHKDRKNVHYKAQRDAKLPHGETKSVLSDAK